MIDIQFFKLDSGADAALFVNGDFIASVDINFDEDGSIVNLEDIAEKLALATKSGLQLISDIPTPDHTDWTWSDIYIKYTEQQNANSGTQASSSPKRKP